MSSGEQEHHPSTAETDPPENDRSLMTNQTDSPMSNLEKWFMRSTARAMCG